MWDDELYYVFTRHLSLDLAEREILVLSLHESKTKKAL